MGYQSKSILQIVKEIEHSKVYLPALQRKFVWGKPQIELLFDSLMRNFPIGTFLFWHLKREDANNYVFYEFLKEYDQRNPYNQRKLGSFLNPEITGVLDGQQRLSSMYIGLQGTHTEKTPYKRKTSGDAYRKTQLYLNLLSFPYHINEEKNRVDIIEEKNFEFRFLTKEESETWISRKINLLDENGNEKSTDENMYWFRVGEVLDWSTDPEYDVFFDDFIDKCKTETQKNNLKIQKRFVKKGLEVLFNRITKDPLVNYFEIDKKDLEDILKIFIRVNSGGTQLSKTDLLFSTIVATWDNGREEIENLLQKINNKGYGFGFSNEFLMRACLVLTDAPVLFKVNSFVSENVQRIKDEWFDIAKAIEQTVDLLVEYGFSQSLLTSQNATIIIAYYIYKKGILDKNTKLEIKKYLIHALLNGIYGSSQDQLIAVLRNSFREKEEENGKTIYKLKKTSFSFDELLKLDLPSRKSLYITEFELENFMTYRKGISTFFVLSLLYPNLKYEEVQFHQDHIHPASKFSSDNFKLIELSDEEQEEWLQLRDMIPNLQLMEGRQNESKNATEFNIWLSEKDEQEQRQFKVSNFIPEEVSLDFRDFKNFFEKRKVKLKTELKKVLAINNEVQITNEEFLEQETDVNED